MDKEELETNNKEQSMNYEEPVRVINLSNKDITVHQISLLSRGHKYTLTLKENIEESRNDIKHFIRKVKLQEYFQESTSLSQENLSMMKNKGYSYGDTFDDKLLLQKKGIAMGDKNGTIICHTSTRIPRETDVPKSSYEIW